MAEFGLSIVIPTFHEVQNLKASVEAVAEALHDTCSYEVLFMDDCSQDGSVELVATLSKEYPVRLVERMERHGLSEAVIDGFKEARYDYIIVMDADLSHPAAALPQMLQKLHNNQADFVVGSRYIQGGSLDGSWGFLRRLNSKGATWLAKPLATVSDPMSGFFGIRRELLKHILPLLSPIGYKIGLEVLVKSGITRIYEHPIHFQDRQFGQSKMTFTEQYRYLRHLRRLYQHKFTVWAEVTQFATVGLSGFLIDLSAYFLLQFLGLSHGIARAISFWFAVSWNWFWNRTLTFSNRMKRDKMRQWSEFVISSLFGFSANVGAYWLLTYSVPFFSENQWLALVTGVLLGMGFNYTFSSLFVFPALRQAEPGGKPPADSHD